jgi:hypothetical protein
MIDEEYIGKNLEESGSGISRYYIGILLQILRKTIKTLTQDSSCPCRNLDYHFINTNLERYR